MFWDCHLIKIIFQNYEERSFWATLLFPGGKFVISDGLYDEDKQTFSSFLTVNGLTADAEGDATKAADKLEVDS